MVDLSVKICGVTFKTPIIAASGTFGFGEEYADYIDSKKLGGITLKALTCEPRDGNPTPRIAETSSGILNSVGLQNPGIDSFLRDKYHNIIKLNTVVIANIAGSSETDYLEVIERLNDTKIPLFEINVSCPNVKCGAISFGTDTEILRKLVKKIKKISKKPIIIKLTPNVMDIVKLARAAAEGGADALSLINTITGMAIDVHTRRPILANITGGLSGPAIKPVALRMVNQVYNEKLGLPIIGMGGIMSGTDAAEFIIAGADAVMVGTATIINPYAVNIIADELADFCIYENLKSISELKGTLLV